MHSHAQSLLLGIYKDASGNKHHVEVRPEFAVNQHYKKCHFSKGECHKMMANVTQDDTILKYKDKLINNVDLALKELNLMP